MVAIGNDDAPEQREQQDKERAAKAAAFWQEIAKETRQEPPNQTHKEWEEGLPIAPQAKAKKLLEAITVQEIREGTFPDAKSMPTYNPITNRFYHLLFSELQPKTPADVALAKARKRICLKIARMFNQLLLRGTQPPDEWRRAEVVCLLKTGDPEDMGNYRPISLLPALYKLYTGVITRRLTTYTEENNLISGSQAGGRPGRSTYQLIAALQANISFALARHEQDQSHTLYVLFLDLQKAYNSVPHWAISRSLRRIGVPEQFASVMNLYKNLASTIRMGRQTSQPSQKGAASAKATLYHHSCGSSSSTLCCAGGTQRE